MKSMQELWQCQLRFETNETTALPKKILQSLKWWNKAIAELQRQSKRKSKALTIFQSKSKFSLQNQKIQLKAVHSESETHKETEKLLDKIQKHKEPEWSMA